MTKKGSQAATLQDTKLLQLASNHIAVPKGP